MLSIEEKSRCRYHLGYPQVQAIASYQLGIPKPLQATFLVETAMNQLMDDALERVRWLLQTLDESDQAIIAARPQLGVASLDGIQLRGATPGQTVTDLLEREYRRWAERLADVLGVPLYPFSTRFKASGRGGNIPVAR